MPVAGNLDSSILDIGQTIHILLVVQPDRHLWWPEFAGAGRGPKVEHFLSSGKYPVAQQFGKELRKPCAATKDERSSAHGFAARGWDRLELPVLRFRRGYCIEHIAHTFSYGVLEYCLHRSPRQQDSAFRLQDGKRNIIDIHLRKPSADLSP